MSDEEMAFASLKQELEMSKSELKERTAKFYNDCKHIMERIEDCVSVLEKVYNKREF